MSIKFNNEILLKIHIYFAGRLAKGDQILEANGTNLVGVTNREYAQQNLMYFFHIF